MLVPILAADRVSVVVVRVMVKARVAPVSVKDPVRVVVDQELAADLATRVGRIGVGEAQVTAMVPVVPATAVAMALLADRVPGLVLWVQAMVRVSPVMAQAPWAQVMVRVIQVMVGPDTRNPLDCGSWTSVRE